MGEFKKSRTYKKLVKGSVGWYCEWCGEEVSFSKDVEPEEFLEAARSHNLKCRENPLVKNGEVDIPEKRS